MEYVLMSMTWLGFKVLCNPGLIVEVSFLWVTLWWTTFGQGFMSTNHFGGWLPVGIHISALPRASAGMLSCLRASGFSAGRTANKSAPKMIRNICILAGASDQIPWKLKNLDPQTTLKKGKLSHQFKPSNRGAISFLRVFEGSATHGSPFDMPGFWRGLSKSPQCRFLGDPILYPGHLLSLSFVTPKLSLE